MFEEVKLEDDCIAFGSIARSVDPDIVSNLCKEAKKSPESIIFPLICIKNGGMSFLGGNLDSSRFEVTPQIGNKHKSSVCPPGSIAVSSLAWYQKIGGAWVCEGWGQTAILCLGMRSWLAGGGCFGAPKIRLVVDSDPVLDIEPEHQSIANKFLICYGIFPPEISCGWTAKILAGCGSESLAKASKVLQKKMPRILQERINDNAVFRHSLDKMKHMWGI